MPSDKKKKEERGKESYSSKVVKQGKTNTGKDQRSNQGRTSQTSAPSKECNQES